MRNFILGIVVTLISAALVIYIVGHFGFIDMRADGEGRVSTRTAVRS